MKRNLFILFLGVLGFSSYAQVQDRTVVGCDNISESIYSVLGSGKVLVIASDGLDCGICQSKAPGLETWTKVYGDDVAVWGAMTYVYNNNTPTCGEVDTWVNDYGWSTVFAFTDSSGFWFKSFTPNYYVYDPADSSIAYQGPAEGTALNTALSLRTNTIGIEENLNEQFFVSQVGNDLVLNNLNTGIYKYSLTSITGKIVKKGSVELVESSENIEVIDVKVGIYLLSMENNKSYQSVKKIYIK